MCRFSLAYKSVFPKRYFILHLNLEIPHFCYMHAFYNLQWSFKFGIKPIKLIIKIHRVQREMTND